MCNMLLLFLTREAIFYNSLEAREYDNRKKLIESLAKKFAVESNVSYFRRQAQTRRQKANEPVTEFAEVIKILIDKGYPDSGGFPGDKTRPGH